MSWAIVEDFLFNWKITEFFFLHSWETFWDFFAIVGMFACGLYTFGLLVTTIRFVRTETSMVDDLKIKMWDNDRKKYKKEIKAFL